MYDLASKPDLLNCTDPPSCPDLHPCILKRILQQWPEDIEISITSMIHAFRLLSYVRNAAAHYFTSTVHARDSIRRT